MTAPGPTHDDPWWASGRDPGEGIDPSEDPFDAHRDARRGGAPPPGDGDGTDPRAPGGEAARLATDAMELIGRLAAEASRRVAARATSNAATGGDAGAFTRPDGAEATRPGAGGDGAWRRLADGIAPHEDGRVCDACPVCIGLRALRQVRPEVIGHLSEAAHHVSLALRAFADAQVADDEGLEKIDLDP